MQTFSRREFGLASAAVAIAGRSQPPTPSTIGQRLRHARVAKGLTIEQCCEAIEAKDGDWLAWESDPAKIPMTPGVKICDLLGVDFRWLAGFEQAA